MPRHIFVLLLVAFAGCAKPAPQVKTYARPEVGMLLSDFDQLSKPITLTDDLVSVSGIRATLKLVSTPERESNGCTGTFSFLDNKLETIQRLRYGNADRSSCLCQHRDRS